MLGAVSAFFAACSNDNDDEQTRTVNVQLVYDQAKGYSPREGVKVVFEKDGSGYQYESYTNSGGTASILLPVGVYKTTVSDVRSLSNIKQIFNGTPIQITVTENAIPTQNIEMECVETNAKLLIKELYVGGCQKDDGSGAFARDQYAILYNNSDEIVSLGSLCLAMVLPYNANSGSNADYVDGSATPFYAAEGWIPAGTGIWYFPNSASLAPGEQMVIAMTNAVDNTATYTNSINFDNPNYYCLYDLSAYANTIYYPTPAASIPSSHYLKAYHYGTGNAWPLSQTSPAFFIFEPRGTTIEAFVSDVSTTILYNNSSSQVRKKVPNEWVIDAVEIFNTDATDNKKRFTVSIDAGYVEFGAKFGRTVYRNVDKEATEAIASNAGKLVYGYSLGVGTTDPSGIDAEESIANGARIIYLDTNNSSIDFHQRGKASIKN